MPRILGIDPGSLITGYGLLDLAGRDVKLVASGTIATGGGDFPARLATIFRGVEALVGEHRPEELAIENVFVSRNAASALKLGQARAAAICGSIAAGLPVFEYTPREIKQAVVGRGGAPKEQVQHMVRTLLGVRGTLAADAADALAVALCHAFGREARQRLALAGRKS